MYTRSGITRSGGCCDATPRPYGCNGCLDDYRKTSATLISRSGYSGFGTDAVLPPAAPSSMVPPTGGGSSIFGTIGGALRNVFNGFVGPKPPSGSPYPMQPVDQGVDTTTLLIGGVAVAGAAYFLLRKKA